MPRSRLDRRVGDDQQLRVLQRPGVGGAVLAVKQRHLAEEVARFHQGEHGFPAVGRALGDGDPAGADDIELLRFVALGEQLVVTATANRPGARQHEPQRVLVEGREQV